MTKEELNKKIWARKILLEEASYFSKIGTSAVDFMDIIENRTEELSQKAFDAKSIIPNEIKHIVELIWRPLK